MNDTRARFEEIWPVPDHVEWHAQLGRYEPTMFNWQTIPACDFYNTRLDTFTRCQETTSVVASLVDDLITEIEFIRRISGQPDVIDIASKSINRAKQIMGRE